MELYVVVWDDAHGDSSMFDHTNLEHKPYRFTSVGILVKSDAAGVSLAREEGEDGRWRDHEFIPRAMIVDEWSQGIVRKKRKRKQKEEPVC